MKAQLERLTSSYQTLISLLSGISALIVLLSDTVQKVIEAGDHIPAPLRPHAKWLVIGTLSLIAVLTLLQALARRSVLRVKERFLISPHDPAHLVGREKELERLAAECAQQNNSLVFLTGESGAGKSALVRAGLLPYLLGEAYWTEKPRNLPAPPQLYPVLLDGAGIQDWKEGIEKALCRVLPADAQQCEKLDIPPFVALQSPFDWLASVHDASCRRVVLILDQMDDYIAMHREQLFANGKIVPAEKVIRVNPQWKKLAGLVRNKKITLLLICRADTSIYLEAFRFIDPETPVIFPLHQQILSPLLDSITQVPEGAPPVITDPEHGWFQLRDRLVRDLADGHSEILPIRLVVALSGLRTFRWLTPGEYQKGGRAAGLERLHILEVMHRAARASKLSEQSLLHMLQALISADASKTQICLLKDLTSAAQADEPPVKRALHFLENEHLIRRIPGEQAADSFMLYHDQLASGIRDARRAQDFWNVRLRERARTYADAIGWSDRWRALMPLREQAIMLWQCVRGRVRYGSESVYAVVSTVRLFPVLLITILGFMGIKHYQQNALEREAEGVVAKLANSLSSLSLVYRSIRPSSDNYFVLSGACQYEKGWRSLASLRRHGRLHALSYIVTDASLSQTFLGKYEVGFSISNPTYSGTAAQQLAHAICGLATSDTCLEQGADMITAAIDQDSIVAAYVASSMPWDIRKTHSLVAALLARMEKPETTGYHFSCLGVALGALAERLPVGDTNVKIWTNALVTRMINPDTESNELSSLGEALADLAERLPEGDTDVKTWANALVTRMINPDTDSSELSSLGEALAALAERLSDGDADVKKGITVLLACMEKLETENYQLDSLGEALVALAQRLPDGDADVKNGAAILVSLMEKPKTNRTVITYFGKAHSEKAYLLEALVALADRLPEGNEDGKKLVTAFLVDIEKPESTEFYYDMGTLADLAEKGHLSPSQAETCAGYLWKALQSRPDSETLSAWCRLEVCSAALDQGSREKRVQNYLELLKHPFCVGESRVSAIQGLEKVVNESFTPQGSQTPDVWKVVEWVNKMNAKGWHLNLRREVDLAPFLYSE